MSDHPRYQLLRPIGEGPLARVYLGHDRQARTDVAVKVLRDTVLRDGLRTAQLLDGAGVWAQLADEDHRHLVRVLEIDGPRGWLVLEYLPRSLAELLQAGPLPPDQVREVLRDALEGLAVLHRHGRLHGAVKPANLLLTPEHRVKLGEAPGIDLAAGETPAPEGSLKYVAPEILDPTFGPVGPGADLYALGFTALELLAGPGFDGLFPGVAADPVVGWIRVHAAQERPPSALFVCPSAPDDLVRVIDRLLVREVADRYASAEEALTDLGEPEGFELIVPAPGRRPKRGRLFLVAAVLLMALVGVGAGLAAALLRPRHGALEVTTEPAGAKVFVDDAEQEGRSPAAIGRLAPGRHRVRVELPGYEPQEQEATVTAGDTAALAFRLEFAATEADVHIESTPAGALVEVDGKSRGPTPARFKLRPGTYRIGLTLDGYWPTAAELVVPRGHGKVSRPFRLASKAQLRNSIGMDLRYIKAGEFRRGSPPGEAGRAAGEGPVRTVRISRPFYLGAHEVSQAQYEAVMGGNPSAFTAARGGGPTNPVDGVSHDLAVAFCRRLSELPAEKAAGRVYRLPTEAEWEYAARAGTAAPFAFGGRLTAKQAAFDATVPYGGAAPGDRRHETRPAADGEPNAWGLYNMHGNVWEWCQDWFDADYYRAAPEADPPGPPRGERRVLRGGSYLQPAGLCRSATRHADTPAATSVTYGFRVVCEMKGK